MTSSNIIWTSAALTLVALGCGSTGPKDESDVVENRNTVTEYERLNPLPGPAPQVKRQARPQNEGAVEIFELTMGQGYRTQTGTEVLLAGYGRAGANMELSVVFSRADEIVQVDYAGRPAYLEGVAFGSLYTVSDEGGHVIATFRRGGTAPMDVASAGDVAITYFRERPECQSATQMGSRGERNGTIVVMALNGEEVLCQARVGLYTGRLIE